MIFLAKGHYFLGRRRVDENGNVVEESAARFECGQDGGSVAVGVLDDDTMKPTAPAEVFGDFDPWGYLSCALKLLAPTRTGNIPDFENIIKKMYQAHRHECPFLDYCERPNCDDCIVNRWMEEVDEGDENV